MAWEIGAIENNTSGTPTPIPPDPTPVPPPADGRPPAPTLQAPTTSQVPVTINWNAVANVTGYNIYRGDSPDQLINPMVNVSPAVNSYVDSSVQAGHTYYYGVTSFDANKESAMSNMATVVVTQIPVPIPIPPPVIKPTTIELSVDGAVKATGPIDQPLIYKINTNRKTKTITVVTK